MIEKKTQAALSATQDKNRLANELSELRDQVDIKDRKVNVLQRKVRERETESYKNGQKSQRFAEKGRRKGNRLTEK